MPRGQWFAAPAFTPASLGMPPPHPLALLAGQAHPPPQPQWMSGAPQAGMLPQWPQPAPAAAQPWGTQAQRPSSAADDFTVALPLQPGAPLHAHPMLPHLGAPLEQPSQLVAQHPLGAELQQALPGQLGQQMALHPLQAVPLPQAGEGAADCEFAFEGAADLLPRRHQHRFP